MKFTVATLVSVVTLLASTVGVAQNGRSDAGAIVVHPAPSFEIDVFLDRPGSEPEYAVGDPIEIGVSVARDAYVYLFSLEPDGVVTRILPNPYEADAFMRAGETRIFPSVDAAYRFTVDPPLGTSYVVALASRRPLDTSELARAQSSAAFATSRLGEAGFRAAFGVVVEPLPYAEWATAQVRYRVVSDGAAVATASLAVDSDPPGADVFVDDEYRGVTPLRITVSAGRHVVRVERAGYPVWQRTVTTTAGTSTLLEAALGGAVAPATVRFDVQPSDADLYLDGRFVGRVPSSPLRLDPGTYVLRFERAGYEGETTTVVVRSGETRTLRVRLSSLAAALQVETGVGGALVFLDGRSIGSTSIGTGRLFIDGLEPGRYQLTVVAPGYETYVTWLDLFGGRTRTVVVAQDRR